MKHNIGNDCILYKITHKPLSNQEKEKIFSEKYFKLY